MTQPTIPKLFQKQVETACKHYSNTKRIAKLSIASDALLVILSQNPAHPTDDTGRAMALQKVINQSFDDLRAVLVRNSTYSNDEQGRKSALKACNTVQRREEPDSQIYICLYFYLYKHDPLRGVDIKNVGKYVDTHYLPDSTYKKRRKEGIARLSYYLSLNISQATMFEPIPRIGHLVGRQKELNRYRKQLQTNRLTIMEGPGGIGKTVLAAQLATEHVESKQDKQPVCWLTIRPGWNDSARAILNSWAIFLAHHKQPQLLALLRIEADAPPEEASQADIGKQFQERLGLLRAGLKAIQPLLCLDNLEEMPTHEIAFWSLLQAIRAESLATLLLVSRHRPAPLDLRDYEPLTGLAVAETETLLHQFEINLSPSQLQTIWRYTEEGNPRLLELWGAFQQRTQVDFDESLARLSTESGAVQNYLTREILGTLSEGEDQAVRLLALRADRQPINAIMLEQSADIVDEAFPDMAVTSADMVVTSADFETLKSRGIVNLGLANELVLSPIISDYLQHQHNTDEADFLKQLHQWLVKFYELQANNLEEMYHKILGGQPEAAISQLKAQKELLLKQGQAPVIAALHTLLADHELGAEGRKIWHNLKVDLIHLLGHYQGIDKEIKLSAEDISPIERASMERTQATRAKVQGNIEQAANHYRRALEAIEGLTLEAWLARDLAWVLQGQDKFDEAWQENQRAQVAVWFTRANIATKQGNYSEAETLFKQAVTLATEIKADRRLMQIRNNWGILLDMQGKHQAAIEQYKVNLPLTRQFVEKIGEGYTLLNIGLAYGGLGDYEKYANYETQAIEIFKGMGHLRGCLVAKINLTEAYKGFSHELHEFTRIKNKKLVLIRVIRG